MNLASLIAQYGYAAVLVGTAVEGETVLLLAGYSAHRGYLDFAAVTGVAWLGGVLGDQFFFWIGRRHGQALVARHATLRNRVERAFVLIESHPAAIILTMRFMWGMRMALPIAIGISRIAWRKYFGLNLLSAALWAPAVTAIGWTFGALLAPFMASLHRYEHWVMAGIAAAVLLFRLAVRQRRRRQGATRR